MNARLDHTLEPREPASDYYRRVRGSSVAVGACLYGAVHYAVGLPLETLSHYSDRTGIPQRRQDGDEVLAPPVVALRWVSGEQWLTT
jgi:hypothetical protein